MKIALYVVALILAGCATVPTDISFDPEPAALSESAESVADSSQQAMLLLAIGPIGTAGGYMFQKLNNDKSDFGAEPVGLTFAVLRAGNKMKRPEDEKSSLWVLDQKEINFLIKPVEAGTYAATYVTWNTFNGVSSGSAWACLDEGASVFDIKPGVLNIVSSRDAFPRGAVTRLSSSVSNADIAEQFSRTRLNYPALKGEAVLLKPTHEARWTEKEGGLFSADCQAAEPGTFSLSRISANGAEPDAADDAAIAAALENIKKNSEVEGEE